MKRRVALTALLVLLAAGTSAASPPHEASSLALPLDFAPPAEPTVAAIVPVASGGFASRPAPTISKAIRYRPRGAPYHPPVSNPRPQGRGPEAFWQMHFGVQDVQGWGWEDPGFLVGLRGGVSPDPMVRVGAMVDWRHRNQNNTQVISQQEGPGGIPITVKRDLSRSTSDLVPMMAMLQIGGGRRFPMPYAGIAGGYEILHLWAEDQTGVQFDGTFGGWGWQGWGGLALPLWGRSWLNAEVFYNGAELSRDVYDPPTGLVYRETVDVSGPGARAGLAWMF